MTNIIENSNTGTHDGDDIVVESAWVAVCTADEVALDRGVAALVHGEPVAIFRLSPVVDDGDEEWCAVAHIDPATGVPVMARGLVGSVGNGPIVIPTVASPLHKQRYNLRSGYCLDDRELRLSVHEIRIVDGQVECRLGVGQPCTALATSAPVLSEHSAVSAISDDWAADVCPLDC